MDGRLPWLDDEDEGVKISLPGWELNATDERSGRGTELALSRFSLSSDDEV